MGALGSVPFDVYLRKQGDPDGELNHVGTVEVEVHFSRPAARNLIVDVETALRDAAVERDPDIATDPHD